MSEARLLVEADGRSLPADESRAVWERFSAWMDAHPGDLAGFASKEGYAGAHAESRGGKAVLTLRSREPGVAR